MPKGKTKQPCQKQPKKPVPEQVVNGDDDSKSQTDSNKPNNKSTEHSITMDELHEIIQEQAQKLYTELNEESLKKIEKLQADFEEFKDTQQRLVDNLRHELAVKNDKLEQLETKVDTLEQQSLQKTVRIINIPEIDDDKDIKVNIAAIASDNLKIKEFNKNHIECVHRMGKRKGENPRDLIVSFSNTEVRNKFRDESKRAQLKTEDGTPVYVNDNLTLQRSKLFYDCRRWRKAKKLHSTWTQRGNIMVKVNETSNPTEVQSHNQLRSLINPYINDDDENSDDQESSDNSDCIN